MQDKFLDAKFNTPIANQTNWLLINFGALHRFTIADTWVLTRYVIGEVFCWLPAWVSAGSTIQFDDKQPLPLFAQQPYFVNFSKITISLKCPVNRNFSVFETINYSDDLIAVTFTKKEFYFNCFNSNDKFNMIIISPANNLNFNIRSFGSNYITILPTSVSNTLFSCHYVADFLNPSLGIQGHTIGWITHELSATRNEIQYRAHTFANVYESVTVARLYSSNSVDTFWHLTFGNSAFEQKNTHYMHDYKTGLAANTTYDYYYRLPVEGQSLHYHIRDRTAVTFVGIYISYFVPNNQTTLLASAAGVASLNGVAPNIGGTCKVLRVRLTTNAGLAQDADINLCLRSE